MKIVQILPRLEEGGVERGTVELNRELVHRGYESVVISAGGKLVSRIEADGGRHIAMDVASKNPLSAPFRAAKLRRLLQTLSPDIVHVRSRVPAWLAWLANKPLGIAFVTTVHGFNSVSAYSEIMTRGDRVICVSEAVKAYVTKHYDVNEEKIVVIPRGIDLDVFDPKRLDNDFINRFKTTYGLYDRKVVTTVGRITQLKDHKTFIRAIKQLYSDDPKTIGLIVGGVQKGKEGYEREIRQEVKRLGIEDAIVFTGSQTKVAEIYALSDVVVSSSNKPESFGRSVAEAIAVDTPVVATGHGGVLEIVREGENGYFYNVGDDAMLAKQIEKARKLDFDGYGYIAERFSLEKMVESTLEVYLEAVKWHK